MDVSIIGQAHKCNTDATSYGGEERRERRGEERRGEERRGERGED